MTEGAVGPEEPLFYAGIIFCTLYLLYLIFMHILQTKRRKSVYTNCQQRIALHEQELKKSAENIHFEFRKHFPQNWINAALEGKIFVEMPAVLLSLSWGKPDDINFSGGQQQTWKYKQNQQVNYVVNLWDDKVVSWQQLNQS